MTNKTNVKPPFIYSGIFCFSVAATLSACSPSSMDFKSDYSSKAVSVSGANDDYTPRDGESDTTSPPSQYPPPTQQGSQAMCGGADASLYTGLSVVGKSQASNQFSNISQCEDMRLSMFGSAQVCSKYVSSTLFGCLAKRDGSGYVLEADFALPILKATGTAEVPYDYLVAGVPNCESAKNFLNSFTDQVVETVGNFTNSRVKFSADCRDSKTVVVHISSLEP